MSHRTAVAEQSTTTNTAATNIMPTTPSALFPLFFAFSRPCAAFSPVPMQTASARVALSLSTVAEKADDGAVDGKGRSNEGVHAALSDALWNVNYIMSPEFWKASTTPTVLQLFYEKTLATNGRTKESTIPQAGRGLFAARDLKAGSIVALYPVHTMGINLFQGGSEWVALDSSDQDYFMAASENDLPNYSLFLLGNRVEEAKFDGTMIVDCNPNRRDLTGWLAHRINDGAMMTENSEDGILQYLEESLHKQNTAIAPWGPSPLLAAFTTRDVREGEELFMPYGLSYWLDAIAPNKDEWLEKTDQIRSQEKDLFEQYLYYSRAGLFLKEANALQTIFDEL